MWLCNIRHWDLALIGIEKLPENLKKTNSKIIMKGNSGHNHTFDNGELYIISDSEVLEEQDFTFGYFVAKNTTLSHEDHGDIIMNSTRTASIPDWIYELRKQKEYTPEWLKVVVD